MRMGAEHPNLLLGVCQTGQRLGQRDEGLAVESAETLESEAIGLRPGQVQRIVRWLDSDSLHCDNEEEYEGSHSRWLREPADARGEDKH